MTYNTDGTVSVKPVAFSESGQAELQNNLLAFYTGITRDTRSILQHQISGYREDQKIDNTKKMVELAGALRKELEQNNIAAVGPLLHEAWELKKTLAKGITNDRVEGMYKAALSAGATGGKLLGAGGGGFLLLFVPPDRQEQIKKALSAYQELPLEFEPEGSKIIYQS